MASKYFFYLIEYYKKKIHCKITKEETKPKQKKQNPKL